MFQSLCAECIEFLSQRRSGDALMESRHEEGQTDKQGLHPRKRSGMQTFFFSYTLGNFAWRLYHPGENRRKARPPTDRLVYVWDINRNIPTTRR